MVKEQSKTLRKFLLAADLCIVVVSFFIGYFLRAEIKSPGIESVLPLNVSIGLLPVLLFIWGTFLYYFGMYKTVGLRQISEVIIITCKTAVLGFVLFGSYVFVLHLQEQVTRLMIGIIFTVSAALIILEKIALIYIFRYVRKMGTSFKGALFTFRSILIVGTGKRAEAFIKLINNNPEWAIKVIGLIDIDKSKVGKVIGGYKVLGSFDEIPNIIHSSIVDEIVFIVPRSWINKIEDIMHFCESEGLTIHLATDFFELKMLKAKQTDLRGFPLLTFENATYKLEHLFIKRIFDFIISTIVLIILAPIFLLVAVFIKITSEGSVLFKQERCSLYGRKFNFYKFRTMVVDAESRLKDILKYNEMNGPVFKMSNDPRVTKIGKWLRKYSLDELPQLWNVFKGDMSLVGPRPPLPSEVEKYDNWQRRKLSMRPGITCLWQVSGRSEIADFNEWMKLDLEYIDNWSLWLDFKILLKTIPVVMLGKGAR
ncbi:sugar transferase [candidate division WS5 bacterium]|uniref:Sugar transferase n=1 Tax=candidate division WS5 bacterium TaxID=2093353 RepID=A0A419DEJ8_9BACT|nr:MAG: sugar transferase [candidate division WS5 bacterium]